MRRSAPMIRRLPSLFPAWGRRFSRAMLCLAALGAAAMASSALGSEAATPTPALPFPTPLVSYPETQGASIFQVLRQRIEFEPFNLVATLIFFLAIVHTFAAPMFLRLSHRLEARHRERLRTRGSVAGPGQVEEVSFSAEVFHFLGEVEAVFGIWVIPLVLAVTLSKGWPSARAYLGQGVNFTEPMFVVVIMTIAASRPIVTLAEQLLASVAWFGRGSAAAWWFSILTFGPLLGSFITEPAAMTISALLLAHRFFSRGPSTGFAYATIGCLFVNVSVGGTLTHFAAPPVLMVAGKWGWGLTDMLVNFGWKAAAGIALTNVVMLIWFRKAFGRLAPERATVEAARHESIPVWITVVHVLFLVWTVTNNHLPVMFIGAFLFYLAFVHATEHHQSEVALRPSMLVGFFLAGLVVHGGLQAWWIQPVLSGLRELPLFFGAAFLTAFNDNAAITYLASLVPNFSEPLKHAVVAGAVVGGGLTVIANAPNPAGQSILSKFFPEGVSPVRLFLGALIPTIITGTIFVIFR